MRRKTAHRTADAGEESQHERGGQFIDDILDEPTDGLMLPSQVKHLHDRTLTSVQFIEELLAEVNVLISKDSTSFP